MASSLSGVTRHPRAVHCPCLVPETSPFLKKPCSLHGKGVPQLSSQH